WKGSTSSSARNHTRPGSSGGFPGSGESPSRCSTTSCSTTARKRSGRSSSAAGTSTSVSHWTTS
ncbi:MAG: hypothetical protein AVDCRST_MAG34-462, partial [uncultured Nocardioidaceae bacterium]